MPSNRAKILLGGLGSVVLSGLAMVVPRNRAGKMWTQTIAPPIDSQPAVKERLTY
jgi:hypothetical protein